MELDPTRSLLVALLPLAFLSCTHEEDKQDTGTEDTAPDFHPNVPPGYEYQWDTDGCDFDGDGNDDDGANLYQLAEGHSDGQHITITERWYWFFGGDWEDDPIDTFTFEGTVSHIQFQEDAHPCSECDEEWTGTYSPEELQSNVDYSFLLGDAISGETNTFEMTFLFETLNPNGYPNEDNKMLVTAVMYYDEMTAYSWDYNYASGHVYPDTEGDYGGPSSYDWYNSGRCIGIGR